MNENYSLNHNCDPTRQMIRSANPLIKNFLSIEISETEITQIIQILHNRTGHCIIDFFGILDLIIQIRLQKTEQLADGVERITDHLNRTAPEQLSQIKLHETTSIF